MEHAERQKPSHVANKGHWAKGSCISGALEDGFAATANQ